MRLTDAFGANGFPAQVYRDWIPPVRTHHRAMQAAAKRSCFVELDAAARDQAFWAPEDIAENCDVNVSGSVASSQSDLGTVLTATMLLLIGHYVLVHWFPTAMSFAKPVFLRRRIEDLIASGEDAHPAVRRAIAKAKGGDEPPAKEVVIYREPLPPSMAAPAPLYTLPPGPSVAARECLPPGDVDAPSPYPPAGSPAASSDVEEQRKALDDIIAFHEDGVYAAAADAPPPAAPGRVREDDEVEGGLAACCNMPALGGKDDVDLAPTGDVTIA